ncbi:TPA: hypothetical protein ACGGE8_003451 [Vibrio cholerae]
MTNFVFNTDKISRFERNEDNTTEQELVDDVQEVEISELKAKLKHLEAITADIEGNRKLKKKLAYKTFAFMERFSIFSAIVLWIYISLHLSKGNPIPENVMIALITTTFVTVIGLVGFILKGLFGTK